MKSRVRVVWAVLTLGAAAAIAVDTGTFAVSATGAPRTPSTSCPAAAHASNPYAVAARFLKTAVQRRDLRSSYSLATPALRHGVSCSQWVHGRVPVSKFAPIDWARSGFKVIGGGNGELVLRIFLYQPNTKLPTPFVMKLQQQNGSWHVGVFQPDAAHGVSPAA